MIISADTILAAVKPKNQDSQEVLDLAKKFTNDIANDFGYNFNGIDGVDKIARFVAREQVRQRNNDKYSSKGLILSGLCGRGKTLMAMIISQQTKSPLFSVMDLDTDYANLNSDDFSRRYSEIDSVRSIAIIDDLGAEPSNKRYGNEGYVQTLVTRLYDKWKFYRTPCVITTNLNPPQIIEMYEERTLSRLKEMCEFVIYSGEVDYRKVGYNE